MPDVKSIPFRQANGNGHYESKQLPNDNQDFLAILGLPTSIGNVTSVTAPSRDGQLLTFWQTSGLVIKGSTLIGIVDLVDGVVTTRLSPAGDIVGTTAVQTLRNKTIENSSIVSPSGLTKADVGLGNVDNTSDLSKPISTATQSALALKEDKANKNVANGYAGLDATGKVIPAQLPAAVQGGVSYQGQWNALSNNPTIPLASSGNKGWYYVVGTAGTTLVDGVSSWNIGDWIVSNGTIWDKVDNTDAVTSVSGRTGAVVLTKTDVGLDQVDNTSDATKNAAPATLTNKTISGGNNTLVVRLDADVTGNLATSHLNSGLGAGDSSFWRGDGVWATPQGGGNVQGTLNSVDGEIVLFQGTSGTQLKRPFGTGLVTALNGVYQTPTAKPVGTIVGATDAQTLTNKTLVDPVTTHAGFSYRSMGMVATVPGNVANVGSTATVVLDWVVPAGFMSRDGDAIHVYTDLTSIANANNKIFTLVFPLGGNNIQFAGVYGNINIRAHYILYRASSTQQRLTGTHWRGVGGTTEVDRTGLVVVDWNVNNTLRFYITGVASGDITATGLQYIFVPAP